MLDLKEINEEIAKLEAGKTCYPNCERLAWLYIVRDHLKGTGRSAHTAMAVWDNEPHAVNRETADKWASSLINEDGTRGPTGPTIRSSSSWHRRESPMTRTNSIPF